MKIQLTPQALTQLELIVDTMTNKTGFIVGTGIGRFKIVENLFPVNFDEHSLDEIYAKIYSKTGDRLLGVFFNNCEPFPSDWFIEDIILKIKYPHPEFYFYGSSPGQSLTWLNDVMVYHGLGGEEK